MNDNSRTEQPPSRSLSRYLLWAILPTLLVVRGISKPVLQRIQLLNYNPPSEVSQLATQANMSDEGRKVFYLTTPTIEAKKVGLKLCTSSDAEKTITLGCYVSGKGIFIQKVTDERLAGTMQVTAAHEMLHAVYHEHLSSSERTEIDRELLRVFDNLNNPRLKKLIQIYRDRSPSHVSSELHSFLGTEVANLGPKLEQHYAKYFADRAKLVAMAQQKDQLFAGIEDKAGGIEQQLKILKTQMDNREKTLREMDATMRSGASEDQRRLYNSHVEALHEETNYYNQLVGNYNGLSSEGSSLNDSLQNLSAAERERRSQAESTSQ
jgi:hypothetical protein